MIREDYVNFEIAQLLKENGFDWETHRSYLFNDNIFAPGDVSDFLYRKDAIRIPTLQMAMKWLREVHNIAICICAYYPIDPYELSYRNNKPYWKIRIMNHTYSKDYDSFNTYEEACEVAIKYCLKNLI